MAIYHLSVKIISRGGGISAVGAVSYRAGVKMKNEHDGKTHDFRSRRGVLGASAYRSGDDLGDHDFTQKGGIFHSEILLPDHAPRGYFDRSTLWNSVEKFEKNSNARLAREVVIALPNELKEGQQKELVKNFVQKNFVDEGMCADFSFHSGKHNHKNTDDLEHNEGIKKDNPHVHIMLTVRPINEDGAWGAKSQKEYILDRNGERIRLKSGNWKSRKINANDWEDKETLMKWRKNWADVVNREFERLGIDERIDHRTLKAQGIDREPTIHVGVAGKNMEKRGVPSERAKENREIIGRNRLREEAQNPENIADFMHELKKAYIIASKEITAINNRIGEIEVKNRVSRVQVENLKDRAELVLNQQMRVEELKAQRQKLGVFASKKAIDGELASAERLYENATNYFKREFKIAPNEAQKEVLRLENSAREAEQEKEKLKAQLPPVLADKELFEHEYKRLMNDIRHDRQRILARLVHLEREIEKNLEGREFLSWKKRAQGLDDLFGEPEKVRKHERNLHRTR